MEVDIDIFKAFEVIRYRPGDMINLRGQLIPVFGVAAEADRIVILTTSSGQLVGLRCRVVDVLTIDNVQVIRVSINKDSFVSGTFKSRTFKKVVDCSHTTHPYRLFRYVRSRFGWVLKIADIMYEA